MNKSLHHKKYYKLTLILVSIFLPLFFKTNNAKEINYEETPNIEYLKRIPKNDYILGEGDELLISIIKDIKDFNIPVIIDATGTINLPRLGRIYISGLSVSELKNLLSKEYTTYVKQPNLEILITKHRPVRVYVDGEVEKPGLYRMNGSYKFDDKNITKPISSSYFYPTLFDAIKVAGGINYYSDLSNIEVIRKNNLSNGGGKIKTKLNFLDVLNGKNVELNIRIYDGDYISIKTSKNPTLGQISKAITTNLNPEFIKVSVSGRVENPGIISLKKSTTLNEAISISGGPKAIRGKVNFIRLKNGDGLDKRSFKFTKNAKRGSFENPYLQPGDIIYVGKNKLNLANEIISDFTKPFVGIYGTYKFFD